MKKCCSLSLLFMILYLAKMHHANYYTSISKISLICYALVPEVLFFERRSRNSEVQGELLTAFIQFILSR